MFSFHISNLFPSNFFISIFELLAISLHPKNQYRRSPTVTRIITIVSQTLDHKGIPLKPIITFILDVYFKLVQLFIANKFSVKE
jgi:hypothetical protein